MNHPSVIRQAEILLEHIAEYVDTMEEIVIKEKELAMQKFDAWEVLKDRLGFREKPY